MVPSVVKKIFQSISSPLQPLPLCVGTGCLKTIHSSSRRVSRGVSRCRDEPHGLPVEGKNKKLMADLFRGTKRFVRDEGSQPYPTCEDLPIIACTRSKMNTTPTHCLNSQSSPSFMTPFQKIRSQCLPFSHRQT